MGGRGSGGRRTGSGRRKKSLLERAISGTTGPRGVLLQHPGSSCTAVAPIEPFDPPAWLMRPPQLVALEQQLEHQTMDPLEAGEIRDLTARVIALQLLVQDAVAVWAEQAPHAFEARTLTPATASAFAMLCRAIAQERALSMTAPAGADHRGLMQRVATWKKDFGLAPLGKAMYAAEATPAANPLDRFTKSRA